MNIKFNSFNYILISKTKFRLLSITQKGEYVFKEGGYIGLREYYNYRINLYSLFDFFVEVWYSPGRNEIEKIEVMESEKTLDLYIDKMNELNEDNTRDLSIFLIRITTTLTHHQVKRLELTTFLHLVDHGKRFLILSNVILM